MIFNFRRISISIKFEFEIENICYLLYTYGVQKKLGSSLKCRTKKAPGGNVECDLNSVEKKMIAFTSRNDCVRLLAGPRHEARARGLASSIIWKQGHRLSRRSCRKTPINFPFLLCNDTGHKLKTIQIVLLSFSSDVLQILRCVTYTA